MRAVLQRVKEAWVRVEGREVARIGPGWLVLVGVTHDDGPDQVAWLARKIAGLRGFPGNGSGFDRDVREVGGEVLLVSQFTLYGNPRKGRRPSFTAAAPPDQAAPLIDALARALEAAGVSVQQGIFGAHMEVGLVNDGPVTLIVETP